MSSTQLNKSAALKRGDNVLTAKCYYIFGRYALCIDPALEQRGLHMFKLFTTKEARKLEEQIEAFYHSKQSKYIRAATLDTIYLDALLELTEAKDVTKITEKDVHTYMRYFREKYASSLYVIYAGKAIRCFIRMYRQEGYPVLLASQVKNVCRLYEPQ